MRVDYEVNRPVSTEQFIDCLRRSTLAERRPTEDLGCMRGMVENSNLLISAWRGETLVGIARSVTDFHYACYLSDLAVDRVFQKRGIGRTLQQLTQAQLGPHCQLILIAAPAAMGYYERIGFQQNHRCWVLDRHARLRE